MWSITDLPWWRRSSPKSPCPARPSPTASSPITTQTTAHGQLAGSSRVARRAQASGTISATSGGTTTCVTVSVLAPVRRTIAACRTSHDSTSKTGSAIATPG